MRRPSGSQLTTSGTTLAVAVCVVRIPPLLFAAPQHVATADAFALERVPAEPLARTRDSRSEREPGLRGRGAHRHYERGCVLTIEEPRAYR